MMLFCMESANIPIHWTEVYVIVAVSAALIEQVRKVRKDWPHMRISCHVLHEFLGGGRISHTNVGRVG
jgi:mitochondrial fission protein ELM1